MDVSWSNTVEPSTDYDSYAPNTTRTPAQHSQQGTSTEYGFIGMNRMYPSDNTSQGASQQCAIGPSPGQNLPTAPPQYEMTPGMYPQDGMFVQQSGMMPQPYLPYNEQFIPEPNQVQPQPTVYYINGQQEPVTSQSVEPAPSQNSRFAIILSCFAFWLCGLIFGLIAFIFAMAGRATSNERQRRYCTTASYVFSIIGIITGIILIIFFGKTLPNYCNPSCSYGSYYEDGCWFCCEYRSCSSGSTYRDSRGCLQCCESTGWCYYGSYNDSRGCKKCCINSITCPAPYAGSRSDNTSQCCYVP